MKRRKETLSYRYWTREEDLFIKSNAYTLTINQIAESLSRSFYSVKNRFYTLQIKRNNYLTDYDIGIIKSMAGKYRAIDIARTIGRPVCTIYAFCHRNGINLQCYGELYWKTKVSDDDVLLIWALFSEGLSMAEISRKFEVRYFTVRAICKYPRFVSSDYYHQSESRLLRSRALDSVRLRDELQA
ncbi:hypothetical protein KQ086_000699 [Salmonella enterica]|nr:hypothetical protein [Salmonella enterica]EHQ4303805.1 hypothetical protein [Salmonella enterica]